MVQVAVALATAGQHEQAETLACSIADPDSLARARAVVQVAVALATAGQHEQAETLARSITNPDLQARALTEVAVALMGPGGAQARRASGR